MTNEIKTTIENIPAQPGQRLLVVSDIHGHLDWLVQLLKKLEYDGDDILVIVGDLIDKGPESLRVVQYVMDLCRRHPVHVSMGNVDIARVQKLYDDTPGAEERFIEYLQWMEKHWGNSLLQEMLADLGVSVEQVTAENAPGYMQRLREQFGEELDFLRSRPTILTAGRYLFVHGGVPTDDLAALEGTDAYPYLKNDAFWEQGYSFENHTVVTGHWPVWLYRKDREDGSPLLDRERNIFCIDGGCGLKKAGQLNGIILSDCFTDNQDIRWTSYDDFPLYTAQEPQAGTPAEVYINYFDSEVELLEEKGEWGKYRRKGSGQIVTLPSKWIRTWSDKRLHSENYSDGKLSVGAGEQLSLIDRAGDRFYVKRQGLAGWYDGALKPVPISLHMAQGAPTGGNWRREREIAVYELLDKLGIDFQRIDHFEANTMEMCSAIDEMLDAVICKNLFLRNQQKTRFYLLMMPGDKKFKTKELSKQIGSSRLSFGEAVYMEQFLHITPGSVSVMGLMNDMEGRVQLLVDKDVLDGEWFGCHPCMNTSSIRLRLSDLLEKFLPAVRHEPMFVELRGS
ncbi:MAG: metallophosphoesterase [Muribaculaceae bacterium]|nr:metallophosphoesterase [Muribaculaceae bacterium]